MIVKRVGQRQAELLQHGDNISDLTQKNHFISRHQSKALPYLLFDSFIKLNPSIPPYFHLAAVHLVCYFLCLFIFSIGFSFPPAFALPPSNPQPLMSMSSFLPFPTNDAILVDTRHPTSHLKCSLWGPQPFYLTAEPGPLVTLLSNWMYIMVRINDTALPRRPRLIGRS